MTTSNWTRPVKLLNLFESPQSTYIYNEITIIHYYYIYKLKIYI